MTESRNPLVDPNSRFEWGDYLPVDDGGDHGGTGKWNPFTPGQGYTTGDSSWFEGLPLIDSAIALAEDLTTDAKTELDSVQEWIDVTAAGIEVVGVGIAAGTGDWGGLAVAPVVSWALEHVKPLRLLLDEVTGNQDTVNGVAHTWANMSKALAESARQYQDLAGSTEAFWRGEAGERYRNRHADALTGAIASAGVMCRAWATLVAIMGEIVGIVHDFIRELIAAAVGQIVQDVVEVGTVAGAAAIPQQTAGEIARFTGIAAKAVAKAAKAAITNIGLAQKILRLLDELIEIIERLRK